MDETISAADANRRLSRILRGVREGRRYVVTSHGKPVARIVPPEDETTREDARRALLDRLERQSVTAAEPWTRDELYDDET